MKGIDIYIFHYLICEILIGAMRVASVKKLRFKTRAASKPPKTTRSGGPHTDPIFMWSPFYVCADHFTSSR